MKDSNLSKNLLPMRNNALCRLSFGYIALDVHMPCCFDQISMCPTPLQCYIICVPLLDKLQFDQIAICHKNQFYTAVCCQESRCSVVDCPTLLTLIFSLCFMTNVKVTHMKKKHNMEICHVQHVPLS